VVVNADDSRFYAWSGQESGLAIQEWLSHMLTYSRNASTVSGGDVRIARAGASKWGFEMKQRFSRWNRFSLGGSRAVRGATALVLSCSLVVALAACGSSKEAEVTPTDTGGSNKITAAEVKKVLASVDTTWSPGGGGSVDVAAFANSILEQLPADYTARGLASDEAKKARIAESVAAYKAVEEARGQKAAFRLLDNMQFVAVKAPTAPSRKLTSQELAIAPLFNGMRASTLMFAHGDTPMWSWEIRDVKVVGEGKAKVTYTAAPVTDFILGKPNPLTFKSPTATYEKVLEFTHDDKSGWRLSGWPNFGEFRTRLEANVQPKSLVTGYGWWELGSTM
jgi:hypothetical protein